MLVGACCFRKSLQKLFGISPQAIYFTKAIRLYASAADVIKKNGVVPDVVADAPSEFVKVTYPSGATVDGGNMLTPTQVKDEPKVNYPADANSFYLLCLTDPDSPSRGRPTYREWHHWLVGNIPGDNVSGGEVLSAYISPCPPRGTGKHRYVFMVFKQSGRLSFDEPRLANTRSNSRELFKIKRVADKYKMGAPVAGNLFIAEWDEYVETIYANLSKLT